MKGFVRLYKSELVKMFRMTKSYPLNAVVSLVTFLGISIAVLLFVSVFFEDSIEFYCLLFSPMIIGCVSSVSNSYKFDTMIGVVEQIASSDYGLNKVLFARYSIDCTMSIIPTVFLLLLIKVFFSAKINLLFVLVSILGLFIGCYFLGLILYGLALAYRKIDSIYGIVNIIIASSMLSVMTTGIEDVPKHIFLIPFFYVVALPSFPFSSENITVFTLVMITVNAILSNIAAYYIYKKLFNKARKNGTIGQY